MLLTAFVVGTSALPLLGQVQPDQKPLAFEVASVKLNAHPEEPAGMGMTIPAPGRFQARNIAVKGLLGFAYPAYEQIGLPAWAATAHYDIDAKGDAASRDETVRMVRSLLMDRFGLKAHYEQRDRRVLTLTVTRRTDRLQRIDVDCSPDALKNRTPAPVPNGQDSEMPACSSWNSGFEINSGGITMQFFAQQLTGLMQEPVLDHTGLMGYYRFIVKFMRTGPGFPPPSDEYPVIPTALEEQLGLKLASTRAPVEVLVIDHVERPTPD
jgi:uncharacterized protein (TIGR03435 family)